MAKLTWRTYGENFYAHGVDRELNAQRKAQLVARG